MKIGQFKYLKEVAKIERAKKDVIYPKGTIGFQISATRGTIRFLEEEGKIESKDVAIEVTADIPSKWVFITMERGIEQFLSKYQTGINVKFEEVGNFKIPIIPKERIEKFLRTVNILEEQYKLEKELLKNLKEQKQTYLAKMMV